MDSTNHYNQTNHNVHVEKHELIGDVLIAHSKLAAQDVAQILELQKRKKILFGDAAIELGLITDRDLKKVLSQQFNYPYVDEGSHQLNEVLVAAHTPFSEEVEVLRSLRGQLLTRWFNLGNKTLAITSANIEDGASLLAANLAIVFSQLNKKTLLIDANLRRSVQNSLFNIETKLGLANILANKQGSYELARLTSLPNLSILPAGTAVPNPQELLNSNGFSELITNLEKVYDIIIFDSSPLVLGSDALTVVANAKAAIVVARKNQTLAVEVQHLVQQLRMTNANILGSVLQDY
jgi:chain length determinant protein tyrosine kinase EpsG